MLLEHCETTSRDSEPSREAAERTWSVYSVRCVEVAANYFAEIDEAPEPPTLDPLVASEAAHLRYVSDRMPGITRRRPPTAGFEYYDADGRLIWDPDELRCIKALATRRL